MITHVFFDLHGTLIDSAKFHPCYSARLGEIMAARYGGTPEHWSKTNRRILSDWDSYYADLDLDGDDGMAHLWEGMFRTTRALFRLTNAPEPAPEELTILARTLPGLASEGCNALYPEIRPMIEQLRMLPVLLGITTHITLNQACGILTGGGILDDFDTSLIIGVDVVGQIDKDKAYYQFAARHLDVQPEHCFVVDDQAAPLRAAHNAGMHTLQVFRGMLKKSPADHVLHGDLSGLVTYLRSFGRG